MKKPRALITILSVSLLVGTGAAVFAVWGFSSNSTTYGRLEAGDIQALSAVVSGASILPESETLTSTLGFETTYDSALLVARAQTTDASSDNNYISGEEFEGDELRQARDYSSFIFELKTDGAESLSYANQELRVSTNIRDTFFSSRESQTGFAGMEKVDILRKFITDIELKADDQYVDVSVAEPVDVVINGIGYRKVVFIYTNQSYGEIRTVTKSEFYLTVQNDRPYWVQVANIKDSNIDQQSMLTALIGATTYPNEESSVAGDTFVAAGSEITQLPSDSAYVPRPIDEDTIMNVVLRNQLAVVRIATLHCTDLEFSNASVIKNACTASVGSGSIVSTDGYIATNGHVTQMTDSSTLDGWIVMAYLAALEDGDFTKLEAYLQYFVSLNILPASSLQGLIDDLKARDETAIDTLLGSTDYVPAGSVRYTNARTAYGVQTSNEPLKLINESNGEVGLNYSETIKQAVHIDSNFDPSLDLSLGFGEASDVSILKMEGNYPVVTLGSIESVSSDSQLTAIGYPAFVDGGVTTEKTTTIPAITQGLVKEIMHASATSQYLLVVTTVPIAAGNSGGPAFDDRGTQVGLNTYGTIECPDDQCFGDGIARDIADYKSLLETNGIVLNTSSEISTAWAAGVEALSRADYGVAADAFTEVSELYPSNYLVAELRDFANARNGAISLTAMLGWAALIVALVLLIGSAMLIAVLVHTEKQRKRAPLVAEVGAGAVGGTVAMPVVAPQAPALQYAEPQLFTPQVSQAPIAPSVEQVNHPVVTPPQAPVILAQPPSDSPQGEEPTNQ